MAPVCAVVVAGGSGQRFGNPGGKQLVNVAGRPLMSWSIRAFDRSDKVGHIVVVCPAERRAEMRRLAIDPFDYDTPISFADAGDTRQDSTRAGVHAVPAGFEYVAIHDGARPLITTEAIDHAIDVLVGDRSLDGVVCGQPAIDTLKIVDVDNIVETPPRELGFEFVDADCTIACQQPKITPHRDAMRANLAHALGVDVENVGVAATTTEKLGWEGQSEGVGAWAVCLLQKTVKE